MRRLPGITSTNQLCAHCCTNHIFYSNHLFRCTIYYLIPTHGANHFVYLNYQCEVYNKHEANDYDIYSNVYFS